MCVCQGGERLTQVILPKNLRSLTFGDGFNQSLDQISWPQELEHLTFGDRFNQSLEHVTLPPKLQTLTFGYEFSWSLQGVHLPSSLQDLTFGGRTEIAGMFFWGGGPWRAGTYERQSHFSAIGVLPSGKLA